MDFEIRTNSKGKIFGIKNIRQEIKDNLLIYRADVAGDKEAANEYLKTYANNIRNQFLKEISSL